MTKLFYCNGRNVQQVLENGQARRDGVWDYRLLDLRVTNVTPKAGQRIPLDSKKLSEVLVGDHGTDLKRQAIQALYAGGYSTARVSETIADALESRRRENERYERRKEKTHGQYHHD